MTSRQLTPQLAHPPIVRKGAGVAAAPHLMAVPIGQKLREVRLARGLELEDVQHRTRIPKSLLVAMENDDLGAFPNQTYARKFFAAYARHLGVEAAGFLSLLEPHGLGGVMEYHPYLRATGEHTGPAHPSPRPGTAIASAGILIVSLLALALAASLAIWTGLRDRQLGSPSTIQTTGKPSDASQPKSRKPAADPVSKPTAIEPPKLPVLRAEPVDDTGSGSKTEAPGTEAPAAGPATTLPLVETPRREADSPAAR